MGHGGSGHEGDPIGTFVGICMLTIIGIIAAIFGISRHKHKDH